MKSNLDIESYLKRISLQDQDALEELYNVTRTSVFGLAFSLLKNTHDAEDVMQDTYVNISRYAHLYNPRNKPLAWILTITRNLCYEKIKKNKKTVNYDIEDLENILGSKKADQYDKLLLRTIVESLTDEERKIIMLNLLAGFKHREIAEMLELNLSTVLSKYHRAIKKVRSVYKEV